MDIITKDLKTRGAYIWLSDFRKVTHSDSRRLVLIAEFWLLSQMQGKLTEEDIAGAINEDCAEGCGFYFLSSESFLLNKNAYRVGVFERRYG